MSWTPSIDLVPLAQHHMTFLQTVDNEVNLHTPDFIRNAIRRYEYMWLPIVSRNPITDLEAPLDVHWIWHCHMLSPKAYASDCEHVMRNVPDHKFRVLKPEIDRARANAKAIWLRWFPNEKFDIDYTSPVPTRPQDPDQKPSKIKYDLYAAAMRQKSFFYHVSLPHFTDTKFLVSAMQRYIKFLLLKKAHPRTFIVPMYDVDFIWHTHQLHPLVYDHDVNELLGTLLDHDDQDTERGPGSKLATSGAETGELWKEAYGDCFVIPGTLYRGESPRGRLQKANLFEIMERSLVCKMEVDRITLMGGKPEYVVDCSLRKHCEDRSNAIRFNSVCGPPFIWEKNDTSASNSQNIQMSTAEDADNDLSLSFSRKDGMKSIFGRKKICKVRLDPRPLLISLAPEDFRKTFEIETEADNDYKVKMEGKFTGIKSLDLRLTMGFGSFADHTMPETREQLWGPVNLPQLPSGISNTCRVASHRVLKNGKIAFTVRIIHSLPLRMSVVQVFYKDKMVAVSELIDNAQLPLPNQVAIKRGNVILDRKKGERAMIIKNADGDWGIVKGHWQGFKKPGPQNGNVGEWGYFTGSVTDISTLHESRSASFTIMNVPPNSEWQQKRQSLKFDLFNIKGMSIDFGEGEVTIGKQCKNIPEFLATAFSTAILVLLCEPRPDLFLKKGRPSKPKRSHTGVPTYLQRFFYHCGYMEEMYSNSWMYWYYICSHHRTKGINLPIMAHHVNFDDPDHIPPIDGTEDEDRPDGDEENEDDKEETTNENQIKKSFIICPWDPEGTGDHSLEVKLVTSTDHDSHVKEEFQRDLWGQLDSEKTGSATPEADYKPTPCRDEGTDTGRNTAGDDLGSREVESSGDTGGGDIGDVSSGDAGAGAGAHCGTSCGTSCGSNCGSACGSGGGDD